MYLWTQRINNERFGAWKMGYSSDRMIFDLSYAQIDEVRFDGDDMIMLVSGASAEMRIMKRNASFQGLK